MPQWLVIGISGVTCGGKTTLAHSLRDFFQSHRHSHLWTKTPYIIGDVQILSQDDYFLPADDLRHTIVEKLNTINFELLSSLDMKSMISDITWTMKGRYFVMEPIENKMMNTINLQSNYEQYTTQQHHYTNTQQYNHQQHLHHQHQQHHQHQHQQHQQQYHVGHMNQCHPSNIMRVNSQIAAQLRDNKINILIIEGFMIFNQSELLTLSNIKFHFHLPYEKCYERRLKRCYIPPDVTGYFEMCVWPHYEKNFAEFRDRTDITFLNGEMSKEKIFKFVLKRINAYVEERCDAAACPPPHKLLGIPIMSTTNGDIGSGHSHICPMEQQ